MAEIYSGAVNKGLEGVVACTTAISSIIDATLCFRGYTIEDLADNATFEEVAYLLWEGRLPSEAELKSFKADIERESVLEPAYFNLLKEMFHELPKGAPPMDAIRTAVSLLSFYDPDVNNEELSAVKRKALRLTAKVGAIIGVFEQVRNGREPLAPVRGHGLGWNLLYLITAKEPSPEWARIMDVALILHADHELNCSTFTTRVIASSLSDLHSAVVGAIGALKGRLHGGANTAVMEMLEEIATFENAEKFVQEALEQKKRVMGIGHRVYKNGDPRAKILQRYSKQLTKETGKPHFYDMSVHIDNMMQEKKGLMPNVDFYSATVYSSMGIPGDLFTPIFVASRIVGWCAHAMEQWENNRIYRPRGEYTGPTDLKIKR